MSNGIVYPPGIVSPLGAAMVTNGIEAELGYVGWEGTAFHLMGGQAPQLDLQNGFVLRQISGLQAPFRFLDNQGARQDGITYLDSLRDPAQIDMVLEAWGATPDQFRQAVRSWIAAWRSDRTGILTWHTNKLGEWWMPVRQAKNFPDQLKQYPAMHRRQIFTWTARGDNAFWYGPNSVCAFTSANGSGYNTVTNLGTEPAWARHLCTGPGTFTIGDGGYTTVANLPNNVTFQNQNILVQNTPPYPLASIFGQTNPVTQITFGPLLAGQQALITTLPRLRGVVDVSASAPAAQVLNQTQAVVAALVNFATQTNTPPLLQHFESLFGIVPPQGPMYSLLNGRFTKSVPGKLEGVLPVTTFIPVSIIGGNSSSQIVTSITPQRVYPE